MMVSQQFDVAVIGAGLGGLSAGIRLRQAGMSVLILERLGRAGGLCGTAEEGGRQFVIACNDFGSGLLADLGELGVQFPFERTRSVVHFEGHRFSLPPNLQTLMKLLPHGKAIARHIWGLRKAGQRNYQGSAFLAGHLDGLGIHGETADLLMLPAYLMGVSPDRFRLDALAHEFRFKYGYAKPLTPRGGPQKFADALLDRFQRIGGEVMLGTEVTSQEERGGMHYLQTPQGCVNAWRVVSTLPQPGHYSRELECGLPISMLWLRLDPAFALPRGIHSHIHYPGEIAQWFKTIYEGAMPRAFGFHFFASDLGVQSGSRTANIYFYTPRGKEEDPFTQHQAMKYVLGHADALLPGLAQAIQEVKFVSPAAFLARHGIKPLVTPVIAPAGYPAAMNYRDDLRAYFAGAASYPPGDHAGSAIRSSRYVAEAIMNHVRNPHAT